MSAPKNGSKLTLAQLLSYQRFARNNAHRNAENVKRWRRESAAVREASRYVIVARY